MKIKEVPVRYLIINTLQSASKGHFGAYVWTLGCNQLWGRHFSYNRNKTEGKTIMRTMWLNKSNTNDRKACFSTMLSSARPEYIQYT